VGVALSISGLADFPQGGVVPVFPEKSPQAAAGDLQGNEFAAVQTLFNRCFQGRKRLLPRRRGGADIRGADQRGLKLAICAVYQDRESHGGVSIRNSVKNLWLFYAKELLIEKRNWPMAGHRDGIWWFNRTSCRTTVRRRAGRAT